MANDLGSLAEALRQGAAAKAQMGALERQAQSAQAMADTPYATINPNTGYGSPLQAIANALRKDRGREQLRELEPQMADLQRQIGGADVARTMYDTQRQADATTYDRSRNAAQDLVAAEEREWQRGAPARALKRTRAEYDMKAGERELEEFENVATGQRAMLATDRDGNLYLDGQQVPGSEWRKYKAPKGGSSGSSGGKGGKSGKLPNLVSELADSFRDEYANPAGGIPKAGTVSNYITREAPILADDDMKKRQKWWSDFKLFYETPERHANFGSALTKTEAEEWRKGMISPDMQADQIKAKLNTLKRIYANVAERTGVNPLVEDTYEAPPGVDKSHWEDLSADEQREWLEMKGQL